MARDARSSTRSVPIMSSRGRLINARYQPLRLSLARPLLLTPVTQAQTCPPPSHRPDASQVASDLLSFASTLVKQRSSSHSAQPDGALALQRTSNGLQPEPAASTASAAAPGQRSGVA